MARLNKDDADAVIDATINKLNTKYKHRVVARADEVPNPFFWRRPSGHMQLDVDTGGGMPAGGWCLLSGPEGAGKTGLLNQYFGYQQKIYGEQCRVAVASVEFPPDHFYMRERGFRVAVPNRMIEERNDTRRARNLPAFTKEEVKELKTQVGRVDVITGATAEETMDAILQLYATKKYSMIGLDSVSVMLANADAGHELADHDARAALAMLITKFAKKFHPLTLGLDDDTNMTTLVFLSQVRSNNKKAEAPAHIAKYLSDWAATGAHAMKHGKLLDICLWSGARVKEGEKEAKVQTGKLINYEIIKGKVGTHDGIRGVMEYDYKDGIDEISSIFELGQEVGVFFERPNGFVTQAPLTKEVLLALHSRKGLLEMLRTNFPFQHRVRLEILAMKGIECRYS